jgi:ketol-acid reductoisomerase
MSTPAPPAYLRGRVVAILGYDADAQEQARRLSRKGVRVIIGLREDDPARANAEADGFSVVDLWGAVEKADVIQVW